MKDVMKDTFSLIEDLYNKERWPTFKINSGFEDLDFITTGFHCGDLIMIVSSPNSDSAQNTLVLNIASNMANNSKEKVGILSLKSPGKQLGLKFVSMESKVRLDCMANGFIKNKDWTNLITAACKLIESPIYVDDNPAISVKDVIDRIRKLKIDNPDCKLIIIDSLQMITCESGAEISECLRRLKIAAREYNLPIIITSLITIKKVKKTKGVNKTIIDDPKYKIMEKYADVVIFLQCDDTQYSVNLDNSRIDHEDDDDECIEDYHCKMPGESPFLVKFTVELMVTKNKNGSTGSVFLDFIPQQCKFKDKEI